MKQWKVRFISLHRDYVTDIVTVRVHREHMLRGGYKYYDYISPTPSSLARVVMVVLQREDANE